MMRHTFEAAFVVFLILKLTDVIDWSWWWVTAPLWAGTVFALLLAGFAWLSVHGFSWLDRLGRGRTVRLDDEGIDE